MSPHREQNQGITAAIHVFQVESGSMHSYIRLLRTPPLHVSRIKTYFAMRMPEARATLSFDTAYIKSQPST